MKGEEFRRRRIEILRGASVEELARWFGASPEVIEEQEGSKEVGQAFCLAMQWTCDNTAEFFHWREGKKRWSGEEVV